MLLLLLLIVTTAAYCWQQALLQVDKYWSVLYKLACTALRACCVAILKCVLSVAARLVQATVHAVHEVDEESMLQGTAVGRLQ